NRDDDTPGQKAALPLRGHLFQLVGVDDSVVEGKRDFQHRKHGTDKKDRQCTTDSTCGLPSQHRAKRETKEGDNERPFEILQGRTMGSIRRARRRRGVSLLHVRTRSRRLVKDRCRHHERAATSARGARTSNCVHKDANGRKMANHSHDCKGFPSIAAFSCAKNSLATTGKAICASSPPPPAPSPKVSLPPKRLEISSATGRPSPMPGPVVSPRLKRLTAAARAPVGMPGPLSSTSRTAAPPSRLTRTVTTAARPA